MASFISSLTGKDWSPTSLVNRLLKPQFLFQTSQTCTSSSSSSSTALITQSPSSLETSTEIARPTSGSGAVTQQEMVALGQIFDHFDENKDGKISRDELRRSLNMLGIETDDDELIAMINSADWNSDGSLDFSEFASFYYSLNEEMGRKMMDSSNTDPSITLKGKHGDGDKGEEADLRDAFKLFDKDGDGYICAEELQSVLGSMGLPQGKLLADCRNMIRSVDVDGDGQVSFDEFRQMMVAGFGQG